MGLLFFLCVISMAAVTCTPYVAVATGAVSLSADAIRIPGGYVVPERGNVTFTCNSSSGGSLLWRVNLTDMNDINNLVSTYILNFFDGFSSSDELRANPASFTFHSIFYNSNTSIVECVDSNDNSEVSSAMIFVEGSPNCPTVHTTVTTTSLTVTIQKVRMMWLPEWYCVKAISYNGSIAVYNSTLKDTATVNVTSLQPGTVYNISVIPCNMAGCNELCDVYSVQTEFDTGMEEPEAASLPDFDITVTVIATAATVVVVLAIAMITGVGVIVVCALKRKVRSGKSGCGEGHYKDTQAVDPPYDDLVTMSTSLQEPNSSSVDAVKVHQASIQLHSQDATSTTAAPNEESVGGVTSSDVAMEDNPAYQPLPVSGAASQQ